MLPGFQEDGNLPPGIHPAEWADVAARFGGTPSRNFLLAGLKAALDNLKTAGCGTAYLDGSFVTAKEALADFDGCWDPEHVDPALLDPALLNFEPGRVTQKARYGGELFIAGARAGLSTQDAFIEFFQIDKETGERKGIVALDLGGLP